MINPLNSRRFWTLLLDTAISLTVHFVGGPDVNFVIGALQPIFIFLILSYTAENTIRIKEG